jgi:hypothetical protein
MKSLLTKIVVALLVVGALAGCATVGEQEDAITWLDNVAQSADTE